MSKQLTEQIVDLITPILELRHVTVHDIVFESMGKDKFLRVFIDKQNGSIDLNECEVVSGLISEVLDKEDPIKDAYYLEVSSSGAEKPLKSMKEFQNNVGKNVFVSLYVHIDGEKEYEGKLINTTEKEITVEYVDRMKKKEVTIPFDKIAKGRLAVIL